MITIENLTFNYNSQELFNGLNINFKKGSIYGLLGKNGAGKTSLLKLISGLLFTKEGKCEVFESPSSLKDPNILKDVFFIPETFYLSDLKVKDYINLYSVFYPAFNHEVLDAKLNLFGIKLSKEIKTLSYGQQKKFFLAFAMASSSRILLFDEPTNGLDIPSQREIRRAIIECSDKNKIIIISSHHLKEIESLFDTLVILDDGKIIINSPLDIINKCFKTTITHSLNKQDNVVFSEKCGGGYFILQKSNRREETKVDLEFFFSAAIATPYEINRILQEAMNNQDNKYSTDNINKPGEINENNANN